MAQKRLFHDGEEGDNGCGVSDDPPPKRTYSFKTAVRDVIRGLSVADLVSRMEPMIRNVVKEEAEGAIRKFLELPQRHQVGEEPPSRSPSDLRLDFLGNLPSTIFTTSKVETEDNKQLQIVLYDGNSRSLIQSGNLSCAPIEIVVLNGDFGSVDQEDWAESEFNDSILREREGKRPLITGNRTVVLKNGIAQIDNISFTDNSSWVRSRKFRLGAKIGCKVQYDHRIREARSQPFTVRDHRGEVYKKHRPPQLLSEVWRLEKIAKDGVFHQRLSSKGIFTVKDFLQLLEINQHSLRGILGAIADRKWDIIVEHAKECVIDDQKWFKYEAKNHGTLVLFNSVYKVVGAMFDGKIYSVDNLDLYRKRLVEDSKRQAYENLNDIVEVEEESAVCHLFSNPEAIPFDDLPHFNFSDMYEGLASKFAQR